VFIRHALRGIGRSAAEPRLAALLWLANLLPASIVALPVGSLLRGSLANAPEADRLLDGPSIGVLTELAQQSGSFGAALNPVVLAAAALALLLNALTAGGALEALTGGDERSLAHRFGRGAGRFFGRFVRAGLAAGVLALIVAGLLATVMRAAGRRLEDSAWEPMGLALAAVRLLLVGTTLVVVLMALDFARIRLVKEDARGVVRLLLGSLFLVLRHPVRTLGLWATNGVFVLGLLAAYFAYCELLPAKTWPTIFALFLVQQLAMLGRAGLRVGLYAGELATWESLAPAPVLAAAAPPATSVPGPETATPGEAVAAPQDQPAPPEPPASDDTR
jgi:hypothetical protein